MTPFLTITPLDTAALESFAVADGMLRPGSFAAVGTVAAAALARYRRHHVVEIVLKAHGSSPVALTGVRTENFAPDSGCDVHLRAFVERGIEPVLRDLPRTGYGRLSVQVGRRGHRFFTLVRPDVFAVAVEPPARAGADLFAMPAFLAKRTDREALFGDIATVLAAMLPEIGDGKRIMLDDTGSGHEAMARERLIAVAGDPRPLLGEPAFIRRIGRTLVVHARDRFGEPPLMAVSTAP